MLLQVFDRHAHLAGNFRDLVVLEEAQVFGDDLLGGRVLETEVTQLQQQAFLQVARGHASRVEALDQAQRPFDIGALPRTHRRQFMEGGHQRTVVIKVADDRRADLARQRVVGLHRELPRQVVRQRTRRRQRVLNRRELLHFLRSPLAVAVVEVVAEEVLVVLIVPGVGLVGLLLGVWLFLGLRGLGWLQFLRGHLLEHGVLDHLLVEQIGELECRHRQQLDRLLKRRRQNELLDEPCVKFLLNTHVPGSLVS